jgi:hypothetical protein
MKTILLVTHLAVVLLAVLALWSMRHEFTEKPATRLELALSPTLAVVVAAVLLIVSPGKRFELWTIAIAAGLAIGLIVGMNLKVNMDFAQKLVRVERTWDGAIAAVLLLLLALARLVTSDLMTRQSGQFGVLGASAAFLATYLSGRVITLYFYTAPKTIHLDMVRGERPHRE